MLQFPSNVEGLDDLLRGGFKFPPQLIVNPGEKPIQSGLLLLIKGKSGTGKSTLALQLIIAASQWTDKNCIMDAEDELHLEDYKNAKYFTCEQSENDLLHRCKSINDNKMDIKKKITIDSKLSFDTNSESDKITPFSSSSPNYIWLNDKINELEMDPKKKYRALVIDGLNLLGKNERQILDFENYINVLKRKSLLSILIYEPTDKENILIDYLADIVIELQGEESEQNTNYFLNKLIISKSRYQQSVLGSHQYKIKKSEYDKDGNFLKPGGIYVFPSIHYIVHQHGILDKRLNMLEEPMSLKACKAKLETTASDANYERSLLEHLIGNDFRFNQGSCTVVLGDRGSFKTQLTIDFLRAGAKAGKNGLLLSLFDNDQSIHKQMSCINGVINKEFEIPPCNNNCFEKGNFSDSCYKHVYNYHFRPGCVSTNEFFYVLSSILSDCEKKKNQIDRMVFWDLCQLDYRFPLLSNDYMFFPGFINYLKNPKIKGKNGILFNDNSTPVTSVLMGSLNSKLSKAAYVMADNVFFCWQGEMELESNAQKQKKEGFYIVADRIESMPTKKTVFFIEKIKNEGEIIIGDIKKVELSKISSKLNLIINKIQSIS